MAPPKTNGHHNGQAAHSGGLDPRKSITRPFTLQESLPYAPQTSTIPFIPDIIPDPSLGSGSPALRISDLFSSHEFDQLNREAANQAQLPKKAKQTIDLVLQDLKPTQRTHYTFRSVPQGPRGHPPGRKLSQNLSPVTRAVYDKVGNFFKATKPITPSSAHVNGVDKSYRRASKESPLSANLGRAISTGAPPQDFQAKRSNSSKIEVAIPSRKTVDGPLYLDATEHQESNIARPIAPQQTAETPKPTIGHPHTEVVQEHPTSKSPAFRIELTSGSINRDEYLEVVTAPEAPYDLSVRKNQHHDPRDGHDLIGDSLDQRQRGEAALEGLYKLIQGVSDAVGRVLIREPGYDHIAILISEEQVIMTSGTQQKLHGAILKVIELGCYDQVPLEDLRLVLQLSEGSLMHADGLEVRLDETWGETVFETWVLQLSEVDNALKTARTCLRVLAGGRDDKLLYSESLIQRCIDVFKKILEDVIVPLVELRNTSSSAAVFKMLGKQKKAISSTFSCLQKLFALFAELITKVQLSETSINTLEYTASKLIFVENAYYEKDSAIGLQKFDGIRSVAMDVLCQIFLIKPGQRQGIINDILTSLEKLPLGKQRSRQFKLSDGGSIQPVSALIMRLVQASSGRVDGSDKVARAVVGDDAEDPDDELASLDDKGSLGLQSNVMIEAVVKSEEQGAQQHAVAVQELEAAAVPLNNTTVANATLVIKFLVTRAIHSTKSGETPYRNLLDLFVDDFTTCLDSPDWPSAELLLRQLMLLMIQLFETGKTAAPAKNMALELLGGISAAISRLRSHVKKTAIAFLGGDSDEFSQYLSEVATSVVDGEIHLERTASWTGPYRVTLEYLQARCSEDPHLSSAVSFIIADWSTQLYTGYYGLQEDDSDRDQELGRLAYRLRMMINDRKWLSTEYSFKTVSASQAKMAFCITLLRSPLCESFNRVLSILLGSMGSDQATVRSKSLKSIHQLLETDPSILDGNSSVIPLILECSNDSSTQVRDSALGLLGSCIGMRPSLEAPMIPQIIDRFTDSAIGVRKRAMKLARDIYLRNRSKVLRSDVVNGLLRRIQDPEEGVRDLARQMIEEVWFAPFYHNESTAASENSLTEHVALIIETVKAGTAMETLDKVFQSILSPNKKSLDGPFKVCSRIVASMFSLIDNAESDDCAVPSRCDTLHVLTIFAKADPKLFNMEQIRLLKPNLASFSGAEELAAFHDVTVIYIRVLPQLPTVQSEFLANVRSLLQLGLNKVRNFSVLDDMVACIQVCTELLKDAGTLANIASSGLIAIQRVPKSNPDPEQLRKLSFYSYLTAYCTKHYDLDQKKAVFRQRFPSWQGDSTTRLILDILCPYVAASLPADVRKAPLEAIGIVCQAWPRNYVLVQVYTAFQQVFHEQETSLEAAILRSFKGFLLSEERRSEAATGEPSADKKELTVMGGTAFDDVASATTQRFMADITRIALSTHDDHALLAVEVLGSINRQGLTHPKKTSVTLITLETSPNSKIAELAHREHRSLHEKHETVVERDYVTAVQSAYEYQRDIIQDPHGATAEPFQSKLHHLMEVLKISKTKNRQRFLDKLCGQADFDLAKLGETTDGVRKHAAYARFVLENLAFFEYQTIGELQEMVRMLEKMVTAIGAPVAQAIESEVFNVRMDIDQMVPANSQASMEHDTAQLASSPGASNAPTAPTVDSDRLYQLGAASAILLSIWDVRTYLRRLYGMGLSRHDSKAKGLAKDLNKAPVKVQGIHGDKIWDEISGHMDGLQPLEQNTEQCRAFVELMNVDKEFKVADEEDDGMGLDDPTTPSDVGEDGDRGRKRKAGGTPGGRKKRPRSSSQPRKRGRPRKERPRDSDDDDMDDDWN